MEVETEDSDYVAYIEDIQRLFCHQMTIRDLCQRNNAADKAAGQCRGDICVYIDGSRLLVDVTVADATAPSYRALPPRPGSYLRMLFVDNFLKKNPNYTTTVSFSVYIL